MYMKKEKVGMIPVIRTENYSNMNYEANKSIKPITIPKSITPMIGLNINNPIRN